MRMVFNGENPFYKKDIRPVDIKEVVQELGISRPKGKRALKQMQKSIGKIGGIKMQKEELAVKNMINTNLRDKKR